MSPVLLALVAFVLVSGATIVSLFTLEGDFKVQAWAIAASGTLGLVFAALSYTVRPLDLTTVVGVLLFAGLVGAGWGPPGKRALLVLGFASLTVGLLTRLFTVLGLGTGEMLATGNLSWAVARSAGFVAFLAATGAILLGVRRSARLPVGGLPARVYALHRALGITAMLAVATHLVALRLDTFVGFSWTQLLVAPWTSSYRPFAVTLGSLAMLSLVVAATSGGLRRLLPGWRSVHLASYLTFGLSVFHGLLAGSDSGSLLALFVYLGALVAVGATLLRRFSSTRASKPKEKTRSPRDAIPRSVLPRSGADPGAFSLRREDGDQSRSSGAARSKRPVVASSDRIGRGVRR